MNFQSKPVEDLVALFPADPAQIIQLAQEAMDDAWQEIDRLEAISEKSS